VSGEAPAFYFDLGDPEAYLVAERILQVMPVATEWVPVLARELPGGDAFAGFRCADEREIALSGLEHAAAQHGLQAVRWPDPFPFDSELAMRAATFARQIGRSVAFGLAAFRQAYAGGRSLAVENHVLIAGSACEMHPAAILRAVGTRSVTGALERATGAAIARGALGTPAIAVGGRIFHGDSGLDEAAAFARVHAGAA